MIDITNIYNYYHMSMPRKTTKYDSHNETDLSNVYQSIVKLSKKTPMYKFTLSEQNQAYAIGIKEAALQLQNISSALGDSDDTVFDERTVVSSKPDDVEVSLMNDDYSQIPDSLELSVSILAARQENHGTPFPDEHSFLRRGMHEFTIQTGNTTYQFQLNVSENETDRSVGKRLIDLLNKHHMGVTASMEAGDDNTFSLSLVADNYGAGSLEQNAQFLAKDVRANQTSLLAHFGLNQITTPASNSHFTLNGEQQSTNTNHISVNNTIALDFKQTTDEPVRISTVADTSAVVSKIREFMDTYNDLISLAHDRSNNPQGSNRLLRDISAVTRKHFTTLESAGLLLDEEGYLQADESLLVQNSENGNFRQLFHDVSSFQSDIQIATKKLTLNPLEYIDKVVVTYPNTRSGFPNPYQPSMYSGLLFNDYV